MTIAETILPEFDHEMALTRKVLGRVPDDKLEWKAHPKMNTIGWVSSHLAEIPGWVDSVLQSDSFDVSPPGGEPYQTPKAETVNKLLEIFDKNVLAARKAIAGAADATFFKPWSLLKAGEPVFTMPRVAIVRSMILNHSIHHRAYLCAYLRLNDIPVPAIYGPSGDEES